MVHLLQQAFKIPTYADMHFTELGHDSSKHCFDKKYFEKHIPVTYEFNELGFREKSIQQYQGNEILAIGDSFTLGLGVNVADRWTNQLEKLLQRPVLNFSLNGASNDWIARKYQQLVDVFDAPTVIVHWTFSHRRESARNDWFDDERTECNPAHNDEENLHNWHLNYKKVNGQKTVHSFIPNWHLNFDYSSINGLVPVPQIDIARDGFHYGPKTHFRIAKHLANLL